MQTSKIESSKQGFLLRVVYLNDKPRFRYGFCRYCGHSDKF